MFLFYIFMASMVSSVEGLSKSATLLPSVSSPAATQFLSSAGPLTRQVFSQANSSGTGIGGQILTQIGKQVPKPCKEVVKKVSEQISTQIEKHVPEMGKELGNDVIKGKKVQWVLAKKAGKEIVKKFTAMEHDFHSKNATPLLSAIHGLSGEQQQVHGVSIISTSVDGPSSSVSVDGPTNNFSSDYGPATISTTEETDSTKKEQSMRNGLLHLQIEGPNGFPLNHPARRFLEAYEEEQQIIKPNQEQ